MGFTFSQRSMSKLETCHVDIQKVMLRAIEITHVDFGISEGYREISRQQELWSRGRNQEGQVINPADVVTHIDGITTLGKHNHSPSLAVDIYGWTGKIDYSEPVMHYLAGLILGVAKDLGVDLNWGGFWKNFKDMPHYELVG